MSRTSKFKILGTEPAAIATGVEVVAAAVLAILTAFHVAGISEGQVGLIMAALTAALSVVVATVTKHTTLAGIIGATKALGALAIGFGVHVTPAEVAVILGAVSSVGGLFLRTQTSSVASSITHPSNPGALY